MLFRICVTHKRVQLCFSGIIRNLEALESHCLVTSGKLINFSFSVFFILPVPPFLSTAKQSWVQCCLCVSSQDVDSSACCGWREQIRRMWLERLGSVPLCTEGCDQLLLVFPCSTCIVVCVS